MEYHRIETDTLAEPDRRWLMAQLEGELDDGDWRYYVDSSTLEVLAEAGASKALLGAWLDKADTIDVLIQSDEAREAAIAEAARHPRRYRLKPKPGAFNDHFLVEDGGGRPLYEFTEQAFVLAGEKLTMTDQHGREQLLVCKKLVALVHTYRLLRADNEIARIERHRGLLEWAPFKLLLSDGSDTIEISGGCDRSFRREGRSVMETRHHDGGWDVDIAEGEDDALLLAAMVATELIERRERRED